MNTGGNDHLKQGENRCIKIQKHKEGDKLKLTYKEQRFVEEYLFDLNQTQAAIRAGYAPSSADKQGSRLMKKKNITDAISAAMAERSRRTGISQDRIINELAKVAFANMGCLLYTSRCV